MLGIGKERTQNGKIGLTIIHQKVVWHDASAAFHVSIIFFCLEQMKMGIITLLVFPVVSGLTHLYCIFRNYFSSFLQTEVLFDFHFITLQLFSTLFSK